MAAVCVRGSCTHQHTVAIFSPILQQSNHDCFKNPTPAPHSGALRQRSLPQYVCPKCKCRLERGREDLHDCRSQARTIQLCVCSSHGRSETHKLQTWSTIKKTSGDTVKTRLLSVLSLLSNINGKISYQTDYQYPVGKQQKNIPAITNILCVCKLSLHC